MRALTPLITRALVTIACLGTATPTLAQERIHASPERMEARIQALSQFGANPEGGVCRVAFSEADRAGREDGLPPIPFGLHIDSVPGGGNCDGDVGAATAARSSTNPNYCGPSSNTVRFLYA